MNVTSAKLTVRLKGVPQALDQGFPPKPDPLARPPKPESLAWSGKVSGKGRPRSSSSAKGKAGKRQGARFGGMTSRLAGTYKLPPSLLDVGKYKATKVRRGAVPRVPKGASKVGSEPFSVAS